MCHLNKDVRIAENEPFTPNKMFHSKYAFSCCNSHLQAVVDSR